jgi:hypothetical protein
MRIAGAYALVAAIVAVVFAAGILGGGYRAVERSDYMTYHVAARIVLDGQGSCLYELACQAEAQQELIGDEPSFQRGALPYNSPPWLAVLVVPLGLLSLHTGFAIFTLASLLVLAFATWRLAWGGTGTRLIVTSLLITAWPTVMGAIRGQSTLLVVGLLGLSVAGSGTALGLATLKPTLVPLWAAWLILRQQWRTLAVAAGVAVALVLLATIVVSPQAVLDYPAHLLGVAGVDALGVHPEEMINWRGAAQRLGAGGWLVAAGTVVTLGAVALAWMRSDDTRLAAASAFIATPLVIPHANQHEAILAGLGVVLALSAIRERRALLAAGAIGLQAALWIGPALDAEASAWVLFAALLACLTAVAWLVGTPRLEAAA